MCYIDREGASRACVTKGVCGGCVYVCTTRVMVCVPHDLHGFKHDSMQVMCKKA
jgi:hypothetical protein